MQPASRSLTMFALLVTVCLAVAAFATPIDHGDPKLAFPMNREMPWGRIVGGKVAKEKQFPYQVSLQLKTDDNYTIHFCGGVIINEQWIMTAGHCASAFLMRKTIVKVGKLRLNETEEYEQQARVIAKFVHPAYSGDVGPFDIALYLLSKPLQFNEYVQPIKLPDFGTEHSGIVILSGWGLADCQRECFRVDRLIRPMHLRFARLPVLDLLSCHSIISIVHQSNVCTGPLNGEKSACQGDSGSPLVQKNKKTNQMELVGIVNYGPKYCNTEGIPTVYAKASYYITWINEVLASRPPKYRLLE